MPTLGFELKKRCLICGGVFRAKTLDSFFCSEKCRKASSRLKKKEQKKNEMYDAVAASIPDIREYLTAREVVAIYGIERDSLYRMARLGKIPCVNLGERMLRFNRTELDSLLLKRKVIRETEVKSKRLYSLEVEDCYTIGEVCEKYHINDSSVWAHVRKYSIPSRQIGNYVYVPKEDIDRLYTTGEV